MRIFRKDVRMPKDAIWLLPGLRVKRWFSLIIVGTILAAFGVALFFKLQPIIFLVNLARQIKTYVPHQVLGAILIGIGAITFLKGWSKTNFSLMDISQERGKKRVSEVIYRRMKLNRGPKIVAIGGGTGLSTLLKGIKQITNNVTAVVTVGDDGGSSGRLRQEMGILPPGDIRNCIAALADDDDIVTKLFQYRFKTGEGLGGHSFGNLFLTAMCAITGDMFNAVKESSKVLLIRGRVLPSTLDDMRLVAKMDDGSVVKGESNIPEAGKRIISLSTIPENCRALEDVLVAIRDADLIILGPGSLYTSVIPNILIKDIAKEILKSSAKKIYISNIMTQPGETDGYSVSDHIKAIFKHAGGQKLFDAVLINSEMPENLALKYKQAKSHPAVIDIDEIKKLGVQVVTNKLIQNNNEGLVRHSPKRLARAIYYWYRKSK